MMGKSIQHSFYHSLLRVLVLTFTLILIFDSGLLFGETKGMSLLAQQHIANVVGVKVGVAPTEVNQLTARITELETELEAKDRLIAVNVKDNSYNYDKSTLILSVIVFILLILILVNYALDFIRMRKMVLIDKRG